MLFYVFKFIKISASIFAFLILSLFGTRAQADLPGEDMFAIPQEDPGNRFDALIVSVKEKLPSGWAMRLPSQDWLLPILEENSHHAWVSINEESSTLSANLYSCEPDIPDCLLSIFSVDDGYSLTAQETLNQHQNLGAPITLNENVIAYLLEGHQRNTLQNLSSVMWRQEGFIYTAQLLASERQNLLYLAHSMANSEPINNSQENQIISHSTQIERDTYSESFSSTFAEGITTEAESLFENNVSPDTLPSFQYEKQSDETLPGVERDNLLNDPGPPEGINPDEPEINLEDIPEQAIVQLRLNSSILSSSSSTGGRASGDPVFLNLDLTDPTAGDFEQVLSLFEGIPAEALESFLEENPGSTVLDFFSENPDAVPDEFFFGEIEGDGTSGDPAFINSATLVAVPQVGPTTRIPISAGVGLVRYGGASSGYENINLSVGVEQELGQNFRGSLRWAYQQIYGSGGLSDLSEHSVGASLNYFEALSANTFLSFGNTFTVNFSQPSRSSRLSDVASVSLGYNINSDLQARLGYQFFYDGFTEVDLDTIQNQIGLQLIYQVNPNLYTAAGVSYVTGDYADLLTGVTQNLSGFSFGFSFGVNLPISD